MMGGPPPGPGMAPPPGPPAPGGQELPPEVVEKIGMLIDFLAGLPGPVVALIFKEVAAIQSAGPTGPGIRWVSG